MNTREKAEVYKHNIAEAFAAHAAEPLIKALSEFEGQQVLKVGGGLLKKIQDRLDPIIKERVESFEFEPFAEGMSLRPGYCYVSANEYAVRLHFSFSFDTGEEHSSVEAYHYLATLQGGSWDNLAARRLSMFEPPKPYEPLSYERVEELLESQAEAYKAFLAAREAVPIYSLWVKP